MRFVRRWVAAAVVVPLLAAAGCTGDPEPNFAPPSDSPTQSPSATPQPEAWEVRSQAGAVAFAKHWVDAFNVAQQSGDTSTIRQISSRGCQSCSGFARMLEELYADGGHLESEGWDVLAAVPTPGLQRTEAEVSLRIQRSPQRVHSGDSSPVESFPGGKATFTAELDWVSDRWHMTDLVLVT